MKGVTKWLISLIIGVIVILVLVPVLIKVAGNVWNLIALKLGWVKLSPVEKAVLCSYYRCVKGCGDVEVSGLGGWCIDYIDTACNLPEEAGAYEGGNDVKVCGWYASQFPISISLDKIKDKSLSENKIDQITGSSCKVYKDGKEIKDTKIDSSNPVYIWSEDGGCPINLDSEPKYIVLEKGKVKEIELKYSTIDRRHNKYRIHVKQENLDGVLNLTFVTATSVRMWFNSQEKIMSENEEWYFNFGNGYLWIKIISIPYYSGTPLLEESIKVKLNYTTEKTLPSGSLPSDGDAWTEDERYKEDWSAEVATIEYSDDSAVGKKSVHAHSDYYTNYWLKLDLEKAIGKSININNYKTLHFCFKAANGNTISESGIIVIIQDSKGRSCQRSTGGSYDWSCFSWNLQNGWTCQSGFNKENINEIDFMTTGIPETGGGTTDIYIDGLYFSK